MSRYDIAIKKPPEKESTLKKFFQDTRDQLVKPFNKDSSDPNLVQNTNGPIASVNVRRASGGQDSSAFLRGVNTIRSGVQGETGVALFQGQTEMQGLGEGAGLRIVGDASGAGIIASTGNGVEAHVPVSQFLTITGPNGYRLFLPLRALQHSISDDEMDYNRVSLTIRLTSNQANSLQGDITAGKERLGLNEQI